ncbi:CDP-diacylglycerol--glycerol-3-phosphate 3-phosphatidyltransferase [Thermosipho japonicus]|uniref:CDP-diacylglycerol--glycerol-3-phosphate 3-phosphatidyltransferase n=1 Tax=Thermosipho japonicus TaxID=90323 RepID=A0A841GJ11_9BACT|nr:CDP-diacylglycerol--glycerol-3-phosphate 3-phosphatidyltransferase [Thermosipho japonicus]MBB6061995.1 CDP-diacylglycerol--glycerol-3-phosphate 3-phosphatidyltransferase [Thermosipho japonicus]
MNVPNFITWARVVLTAIIVFLLLNGFYLSAFILFLIASISDYFDGYFARKLNQVTNFGKIFDQMSDKILITSILIVFVQLGLVPAWILVVIVFRDTLVSTVRMAAAYGNKVIAANYFGKLKTVSQMVWTIGIFLQLVGFESLEIFNVLLSYLVVFLTVVSGLVYMIQNKEILKG